MLYYFILCYIISCYAYSIISVIFFSNEESKLFGRTENKINKKIKMK